MNENQTQLTDAEFKKELDQVVLTGINQLGAGTVLGALAIVSRFTEVIYDMQTVQRLTQPQEAAQTPEVTE